MIGAEIRFLTIEDVLDLHEIAIADQGGDPAVLNRGLLESALAMPQQQFGGLYLHEGIPAMAAAYAFHICKNHPFADGNKRAALAAMVAFLREGGKEAETFESFTSAALAGSSPELERSFEEAGRQIPLIRILVQAAYEMERQKNVAQMTAWFGQAVVLTAIYRIAEDMGYEW